FLNYSLHDRYVWASIEFYVEGHADLALVEKIAKDAVNESHYFDRNQFEVPVFWVMEMEKEAIKCWVAAWASSPSIAWNLKHDVRMRLNHALREHQLHSHTYHVGSVIPN